MADAINMFRKPLKKTARKQGREIMKSEAMAIAGEITKNWDDSTWFESWARNQAPGKKEMIDWANETMDIQNPGEYEMCRVAFFLCVYLKLVGWDNA